MKNSVATHYTHGQLLERILGGVEALGTPPLGVHIAMGESAAVKISNMVENIASGCVSSVEIIVCKANLLSACACVPACLPSRDQVIRHSSSSPPAVAESPGASSIHTTATHRYLPRWLRLVSQTRSICTPFAMMITRCLLLVKKGSVFTCRCSRYLSKGLPGY
jgi:hypothetical protein